MKKLVIAFTSIFLWISPTAQAQFQEETSSPLSMVNTGENLIASDKQLLFQENKGQVSDQHYQPRPDVLFSGQSNGMVFHLKSNGISYQLNRIDTYKEVKDERTGKLCQEIDQTTIYRIDINWLNTNSNIVVQKENVSAGFNNYYLEHCPDGALNVLSYENINYQNIYDGIDLKWYNKDGTLKYDYLVAAGADYHQIEFEIAGAESIVINEKGELEIKTPLGTIIEESPYVIQDGKELKSQWVINNNRIHFNIENIDATKPFIIDPVVRQWGTYYGGSGTEYAFHCAVDELGNVHLAGQTSTSTGTIMATSGSHQSTINGAEDAFLTKFNTSGVRQWGTYYGGSGFEVGFCSAIDATGDIYFVGSTTTSTSTSIATIGSHQSSYGGGTRDAFLVKFNSFGVRQWATYYGGSDLDRARSCTIDEVGDVYLAGNTVSGASIATIGSHQSSFGGINDAFLVKFNSSGVRQWGTYYGGSAVDEGYSCDVDSFGNVYITGYTVSTSGTSIATPGSYQSTHAADLGSTDGFLVKFNSSGVRLWGTYYGGTGSDYGKSCVTDASGNVYMSGETNTSTGGTTIATLGSHQSVHSGFFDAFLVKFNSAGVRQWGTFYGGNNLTPGADEYGESCTVDQNGNVYLAGQATTETGTAIASADGYQPNYGGGVLDAFLVKFNSSGVRQWGTYYGGTGVDGAYSCALDASGSVYLAGRTETPTSTIIANTGSHQNSFGGGVDAFLVKFADCTSNSGNSVISSCNPITWIDGNTYSTSNNTATHTLINSSGCDSIVTLDFIRLLPNSGTDIQTACNSYIWINGMTYTSSTNIPTYTLTNVAGCDSTVTLNLTINSVSDISTSVTSTTLTANNSGASYQWLDCNNSFAPISGQTAQTFSPSTNGNYAVQLTQNGCMDTSICTTINSIGFLENTFAENFTIYPNPTTGKLIIEFESIQQDLVLTLFSVQGDLIQQESFLKSSQLFFEIDAANGIYLLQITNSENQKAVLQIIKE